MKVIKYLSVFFGLLLSLSLTAQNQLTSSPYSMYGIGEIVNGLYGQSSAMGGVSYGMRNSWLLNVGNPAGLTGMDSAKIYAETSLFLRNSNYSSAGDTYNAFHGNLASFLLGTRITKRWYMAAGIAPYSAVGYYFNSIEGVEGAANQYMVSTYQGDGGLSKAFLSSAIELPFNLSFGVNLNYYFGNITTSESQSTMAMTETRYAQVFHADFGLQYFRQVGKETLLTIGVVYGYKQKFKFDNSKTVTGYYTGNEYDVRNTTQYIPEFYGIGGSLQHKRMTYAADYTFRKYGSISSGTSRIKFQDTHELRTGISYSPGGRNFDAYRKQIDYKLGFTISNPTYTINNKSGVSWRASAGVALPMFNGLLNPAIFYEQLNISGKLTQKSVGFTVSFSLSEIMYRVKL